MIAAIGTVEVMLFMLIAGITGAVLVVRAKLRQYAERGEPGGRFGPGGDGDS